MDTSDITDKQIALICINILEWVPITQSVISEYCFWENIAVLAADWQNCPICTKCILHSSNISEPSNSCQGLIHKFQQKLDCLNPCSSQGFMLIFYTQNKNSLGPSVAKCCGYCRYICVRMSRTLCKTIGWLGMFWILYDVFKSSKISYILINFCASKNLSSSPPFLLFYSYLPKCYSRVALTLAIYPSHWT